MTWEAIGGLRHAHTYRTVLAPRSGGDFGAEMTTLMLPSSADTMPTLAAVWFSDMMSIEFTRTYEGWMACV